MPNIKWIDENRKKNHTGDNTYRLEHTNIKYT